MPDPAAAGCALGCATGVALTSELGESRAIGDGGAVDTGEGEYDGAGMTVTTAAGVDRRDLVGDGAGAVGLGLGLWLPADLLGDGNGGMIPVGDGDGAARLDMLGDGFGALLALAVGDAFGVAEGDGAADAEDPMTTAGVSATATRPSSSVRRAAGTR